MAIVKTKPTSAGRRHVVKIVGEELFKGRAYAPLLEKQSKSGGRNNYGRITTRHVGGGHRHHYRLIDFKRTKMAFLPPLSVLSTIPTAVRTLRC